MSLFYLFFTSFLVVAFVAYRYQREITMTITMVAVYIKSRLDKKASIVLYRRYAQITYHDAQGEQMSILLPYNASKIPQMIGCQYFTIKDGVRKPLYQPPGIPFMVSATMLEVDAIEIHDGDGGVAHSVGPAIPQI